MNLSGLPKKLKAAEKAIHFQIASGPAIYLLYHGDELVYVGATRVNALQRIGDHVRHKRVFDRCVVVPYDGNDLFVLEAQLIREHEPKYNKNVAYIHDLSCEQKEQLDVFRRNFA